MWYAIVAEFIYKFSNYPCLTTILTTSIMEANQTVVLRKTSSKNLKQLIEPNTLTFCLLIFISEFSIGYKLPLFIW